jgi:predicted dehydrogenase
VLRIGLVDCDTSHVYQFARRLNHIAVEPEQWVDGARVVAASPGTSRITDSARVSEYLVALQAAAVELVARPEDLLGRVDAVMIESNEGAIHRERAAPFLEVGLPVFVDKPFATTTADARAMVELAARRAAPVISASALRFAAEVQAVLAATDEIGPIVGADVYAPAPLHPLNPGLFHYGVHGVELLYTILGPGCQDVVCAFHEDGEIVTGRWRDGRIGCVRGIRRGARGYGFVTYGERAIHSAAIDLRNIYRELLKAVVPALAGAPPPICPDELVEVVAFQEAALASREADGARIELAT